MKRFLTILLMLLIASNAWAIRYAAVGNIGFKGGGLYDVRAYGAVGDGVTDDSAAIQAACDAASNGGTVLFPEGTYLVSDQGDAWTGIRYCVNITGDSVTLQGYGKNSIILIDAHDVTDIIFSFASATGHCVVKGLNITAPEPSTRVNSGAVAISFGRFGNQAESGTLESITVENCYGANLGFFLHGEGAKIVRCLNNEWDIEGGSGTVSEGINIGSDTASSYTTQLVVIQGNKITLNPDYSDHAIYALGTYDQVIIDGNDFISGRGHLIKISGDDAETYKNVIITNNNTGGTADIAGIKAFFYASSAGVLVVNNLVIANNHLGVHDAAVWVDRAALIDNAIITSNYCRSQRGPGIYIRNASTNGKITISDNDFTLFDTAEAGYSAITVNRFDYAVITGNYSSASGASTGQPISISENIDALVMGNRSDGVDPVWYNHGASGTTWPLLTDIGNSWNSRIFSDSLAPTTANNAYRVGDICFNNAASAGGPLGWVCTTAGSPGTWTEFGEVNDFSYTTQTITDAADDISPNAKMIILDPDADYTLSSAPTIPDGYVGQIIHITGLNGETNEVTLQGQPTLSGSNLLLGAATRIVGDRTVLTLMFNGSTWGEQSYVANANMDYAGLHFSDNAVNTPISVVDAYEKVVRFDTNMPNSESVAHNSADDITVGNNGVYELRLQLSASSAGADKVYTFDVFEIAASGASITGATQANPCVITAASHGFSDGDRIKIAAVVGMTELNDRIFTVAGKTADTFQLNDDNSGTIDSTGFTAYASGGTAYLATKVAPAHTTMQFAGAGVIDSLACGGFASLTKGNTLEAYVKNTTDATNITFESAQISIHHF